MQRRGDHERRSGTDSEMIAKGEAEIDVVSECLHTISGTQTERDESFDDIGDEKLIKS